MTPLYGFGDKAVRKKTTKVIALYVAEIKIIGPHLAKRRKWSKPLFCKRNARLNYQRHASHFKRIRKNTAFVVTYNGWRAICRKPSTPYMM